VIRAIVRAAVKNPVAVNLATLAVIAAGLMAYFAMPREVFPVFSLGTATVTTFYPGASPEDVERLVTLKIEDEVEGLDGLDELRSISREGVSVVTLKVDENYPMGTFLDDVRAAMARNLDFPDEVEDPEIREIKAEFPVIAVFVYGTATEEVMRLEAERHERGLEAIGGVSSVVLSGPRDPELWIEVDPGALTSYGLDLATVGATVAARAKDIPLGTLSTDSGDYLMRIESGVEFADDLLALPILATPDGREVKLGDIARLRDHPERVTIRSRFNGQAAMYLQVNKQAEGDTIDLSKAVFDYVDSMATSTPSGVALGTNADMSVYVRNRLRVMRNSALMGGLLVLLSLVVFLDVRVAMMTAVGIPVAFLGGIAAAASLGITMNMLTMFALIVVLGMLVDDAIVVGENVYRHMEEGMSPVDAAIQGTAEVGKPVLATVLTTIAAFLPMLMLSGQMGMFMRPLPYIVTLCLLASLFEALFVLPVHLAHWTGRRSAASIENEQGGRWYAPIERLYVWSLDLGLKYRYVTVALAATTASAAIAFGVVQMRFNLFEEFESKVFSVNVRATAGTSMEKTLALVSTLRERVDQLPPSELESTNSVAGVSFIDAARFEYGQNLGQIWVELREDSGDRRPTSEVIAELRDAFHVPPAGVEKVSIMQPQAGPTGAAIDVSIRGPEREDLEVLAGELEGLLTTIEGVVDIRDNLSEGKREVRVSLKPEGRQMGFSELGLARELRAAFEGTTFARLRRGDDDVEVIVKLPEELRGERGSLDRLEVTLPGGGGRVPLVSVASLQETVGTLEISRDDRRRSVHVKADVNKQLTSSGDVIERIKEHFGGLVQGFAVADLPFDAPQQASELAQRFPGYSLVFEGDEKETNEAMQGLISAGIVALMVMYLVLGTLFKSLAQPFVIMFAIPLAGIGVIVGHELMGRDLSFMSLIGLLALAGVVVNDSLILIDLINRRREAGDDLETAMRAGGQQRFRPIVLTTITTMLGLAPLTFFASGQARFLQPMAISVFFGLAMTTFLILVVVPSAYGILYDVIGLPARWRREGNNS